MICRITLHNYMSHADTVIEPATGLTVLVGPNNCGKSAVVSALETLCNNATGDYMVRHDEKEATVTVETDDGHVLVWRRKGNTVSYVIDGREIHRLNRAVPDELHTFLRLPKVETGENCDPFDVHFGPQKSPIFLLNEPGSRAALFFASSSDAAVLLEMQRRHRSKVKDRNADEKRLKGEIAKLDDSLRAMEPLDGLALSVSEADREYQALKNLERKIETLGQEIEVLRDRSVEHDRLVRRCQLLASLDAPPDLADIGSLESLIADLVGSKRQARRETDQCGVLQCLDAPPVLGDAERLESLWTTLSEEERNCRQLEATMCCLGPLSLPPAIDETARLEAMIGELESAARDTDKVRGREQVLQSLTPPPVLAEPKPLAQFIGQFERTLRAVRDHEGAIRDAAAEITRLEAETWAAEAANSSRATSGPAESHTPRRLVLAVGGLAAVAVVVVFLIIALARMSSPDRHSPAQTDDWVASNAAAAGRGYDVDGPRKPPVSETAVGNRVPWESPGEAEKAPDRKEERKQEPQKETPKQEPRKPERKEERPKETHRKDELRQPASERPRNEAPPAAKQLRLTQVRQLLNDAEMANNRGKHLDAVLGFGEAALLYPAELAEVEDPEKVRLKFMDALKHYQRQVEQALQKAAEHQPRSK
jgi:exonuclease SbcC